MGRLSQWLCLVVCISACSSSPMTGMYSITGRVLDIDTGFGLGRVTLSEATGPDIGKSAQTDATGQYTLTNLHPGPIVIAISKADYVSQTLNYNVNRDLVINVLLDHVTIAISGLITEAGTGRPLGHINVRIGSATPPNMGRFVNSDSAGHYNLTRVRPELMYIEVTGNGYQPISLALTPMTNTVLDFEMRQR